MGRWVRDERDDIIYVGICQLASGCGVGSVAGCARPCDGECGGSARPSCRACAVLCAGGRCETMLTCVHAAGRCGRPFAGGCGGVMMRDHLAIGAGCARQYAVQRVCETMWHSIGAGNVCSTIREWVWGVRDHHVAVCAGGGETM
eukprot:1189031-Prorocentrum_minimum.AAC.1